MPFQIANSIALVTGANRGIGRIITETLLKQGAAKVYAAVRNPSSVAELVKVYGAKLVALELDVSQAAQIERAATLAKDVTLVINNAGILRNATAIAADAVECLQEEINVNVYGLMRMARAFAPVLKANGGGGFVQLNSVASMKSFPDFATYCASKAASYSITQSLRETLAPDRIQVVSVHPGPIATEMANAAGIGDVAESPQLVADAIIHALATNQFHVFPDSMAKQLGQAYASFAANVVEQTLSEG